MSTYCGPYCQCILRMNNAPTSISVLEYVASTFFKILFALKREQTLYFILSPRERVGVA